MNITYRDINTRKMALIEHENPYPPLGITNMYMNIMNEKYSFNHTRIIAKNWECLCRTSQEVAFARLMDIFEACTFHEDSTDNVKTIFNIINEGVLQKVRSGPQAQECMNRKIGKFKIQARKVRTRIRTANKNIPNTKAAADQYEKTKSKIDDVKEESFENFVENCYEEMINTSRKYDQCDRILLNNDKLNKRFNFDKTVREASFATDEDISDCINTLCEYVDTYNIDTKVKFNTCLENIYYSFNRNNKNVSKEKILGDVTDYFILKHSINEEYLDDIRYIITESKVYDMDDFRNVSYLFESEDDMYITEHVEMIEEGLKDKKKKEKPLSKKEQKKLEKQNKPRYSISDFKKSENKSVKGFRDLLNRIYNNSPENIGLEIGNIFTVIRYTFIVGAFGINPVLGIVTMVTDFIMKTETGRNELPRYIKKYKAEIKLVEKNIEKAKSEEEKKKLKAYKKQLEDCLTKMEQQLDSLYTEKENDERHAKEDEEELDESINLLLSISNNSNIIYEHQKEVTNSIINTLNTATVQEDITNLVNFCCTVPSIVDIKTIKETLEDMRDDARKARTKDYIKINNLNECIKTIETVEMKDLPECDDMYKIYNYTKSLTECITDVLDCIPVPDTIMNEDKKPGLSMTSKLKISLDKLRKSAQNLSDKEKAISKQIDISVDTLSKNAERALVSSNREAVIKGTIIPSASKCIKGALITGAAWAVSPAIAVIGLLGAIGTSKKLQSKERQLILDDIEIELNMCERYMKMAEQKDDMQAQRHILQTQRELLRQKQRLQYNMQVKFREKTPPKLKTSPAEESFNISEEDLILERSGVKKEVKKQIKNAKVKIGVDLTSGGMEDAISDLHRNEIKIGKTKIKNKTLTRKEMLENPDVVKQYLKEEGDDPYVNLGNIFSVADLLFTVGVTIVSSSLAEWLLIMICKKIIKNVINLMKIAANTLDPKVEVAIKTTKRKLLTYVHKMDKEIKYCKDPKKRKQLEKERDVLMSCYNDTVKEINIERKVR